VSSLPGRGGRCPRLAVRTAGVLDRFAIYDQPTLRACGVVRPEDWIRQRLGKQRGIALQRIADSHAGGLLGEVGGTHRGRQPGTCDDGFRHGRVDRNARNTGIVQRIQQQPLQPCVARAILLSCGILSSAPTADARARHRSRIGTLNKTAPRWIRERRALVVTVGHLGQRIGIAAEGARFRPTGRGTVAGSARHAGAHTGGPTLSRVGAAQLALGSFG